MSDSESDGEERKLDPEYVKAVNALRKAVEDSKYKLTKQEIAKIAFLGRIDKDSQYTLYRGLEFKDLADLHSKMPYVEGKKVKAVVDYSDEKDRFASSWSTNEYVAERFTNFQRTSESIGIVLETEVHGSEVIIDLDRAEETLEYYDFDEFKCKYESEVLVKIRQL